MTYQDECITTAGPVEEPSAPARKEEWLLLFVAGAIALICSAVRCQIVYRSLIDSFPPQFQGDLTSRYVFPVLALSPSPLPLQAEYIKASWGSCVGCLCISLGFLFLIDMIGQAAARYALPRLSAGEIYVQPLNAPFGNFNSRGYRYGQDGRIEGD